MEVIGIIAGILELIALLLLGKKNKVGFFSGMVGNILWITFMLLTQSAWGLAFVCPIAFILNIKGYLYWRKDELSRANSQSTCTCAGCYIYNQVEITIEYVKGLYYNHGS